MAAGGGTPVRDFAFDDHVAVSALDKVADVANELANGKDLRGRWEIPCGGRGFKLGSSLRGAGGEGSGLFGKDVGGRYVGHGIEERGRS